MMGFDDTLIGVATKEWEFFGKDDGTADKFVVVKGHKKPKETVKPYEDRIADYWLSISDADYKKLMKQLKPASGRLDGTVDVAWSAAFISYCMQIAGAGLEFPYAPGHATWIVQAIKNKAANKLTASLVGYKPGEVAVEVGDLVGRARQTGITYNNAVAKGWFKSHSDIVVEVDTAAGRMRTLGGNVGQTVGRKTFAINANGKIAAGSNLMVHIKSNIAGKIPAPAAAHATPVNVG